MTSPFSDPRPAAGFPAPPPGTPPPPPPGGPTYGAPPPYQGAPPGYGAAPPPYRGSPAGYEPYAPGSPGRRASFGLRLGGYILDSLMYGALMVAIAVPGIVLMVNAFSGCVTTESRTICPTGKPEGSLVAGAILFFVIAVFGVIVLYIRALGTTGQTWGRKIVGIKVVRRATNEPIGIGRAIGRQLFAAFLSGQIFYLGYLWMLWDDDRQTWHDKVVDSIVIEV